MLIAALVLLQVPAPDITPSPMPDLVVQSIRPSRLPVIDAEDYTPVATKGSLGGLADPTQGIDPYKTQRKVLVRSLLVEGAALSKPVAMIFARLQQHVRRFDFEPARQELANFAALPRTTDEERFTGLRYELQIAEGDRDEAGRERVIGRMLETAFLTTDERLQALRSLAGMAVARGDHRLAIERYLRLRAEADDDSVVRANLAALYQRQGRDDAGRPMMREAIQIAVRGGKPVPDQWLSYAGIATER